MVINWDAVNAIGSWVAGIGTLAAVIVALRSNRPKVKVKTYVAECTQPVQVGNRLAKNDILFFSITNIGLIPVNITGGGIKTPKNDFIIIPQAGDMPKILMPGEVTHLYADWLDLKGRGLKYTDIGMTWDSAGNYYYSQVNVFRKVTRALWWRFGKFPPPNHQ